MKKSPKLKTKKKRKAKVAKKPRQIVMASPIDPQIRFAVASEWADDELIEKEVMGDVLPTFIYKFENDGKVVTGLTVRGVNEVVRRLGMKKNSGSKIHLNPNHLLKEEVEREGEKGIEVSVFAEDLVTGNSAWGVKFEPYFKVGRDKKRYANKFAVEKALSKAERNAKRKLISEGLAVKLIQILMKENKGAHVKELKAPAYLQTVVRPPVPVASSPEALYAVVENAINAADTPDAVIDLDERAQASDKLSDEMKAKLHAVALGRTSVLQAEPQE